MLELVGFFGTTPHRRHLLRNLIEYRELLASDGYSHGMQFIDGSFVEDIETTESRSPNDIDLFSILDLPARYRADQAEWSKSGINFWSTEIADRARNKARYSLDTYAILIQERGLRLIQDVIYWYGLFSHKRGTYAWKGFVAVELSSADDSAALAALGPP